MGKGMKPSAEEFFAMVDRNETVNGRQTWREIVADDEFWLDIIKNHPDYREAVALNRHLSDSVLEILAKDNDWRIRSFVAEKRQCPVEIMRLLARDQHEAVRHSVARNRRVSPEILAVLIHDPWERIAEYARKRLSGQAE